MWGCGTVNAMTFRTLDEELALDPEAYHQTMVRRLDACLEALDELQKEGRSSKYFHPTAALGLVLAEVDQRMTLAHRALKNIPEADHMRLLRVAERTMAYGIIRDAYDYLCAHRVIPREKQTEPTAKDFAKSAKKP
jgi:hypothetical protein